MVNNRVQFKETLEAVLGENFTGQVKMGRPEGRVVLPLVTYEQVTNVSYAKWQERIEYQVDVFDSTFATCLQYVLAIDDALTELGYVRTYESPDTTSREETDLYHKVLNYYALVDTHNMNILGGYYGE